MFISVSTQGTIARKILRARPGSMAVMKAPAIGMLFRKLRKELADRRPCSETGRRGTRVGVGRRRQEEAGGVLRGAGRGRSKDTGGGAPGRR